MRQTWGPMSPQQADAWARMFAPAQAAPPESEERPTDPRVAAEDRVRASYDSMTDFERATMRWLLGRDGWTDARALEIRQREWRKAQ